MAEFYFDLFENACDAIFNLDFNGNFTAVNKKTEEITGYGREELIGKSILHILPKKLHDRALDKIAEIESGKTLGPFVIELKSKNDVKTVEITARPVKIEDKITAIQCIARDATPRVKMEQELKEARDLLQIILSAVDECILVINRNYKISKINKPLRGNVEEIIGKSCHEYLHNSMNRCTHPYLCPVEKVFETGKPFSATHVHFSQGKPCVVEIEAYPLYDSSGVVMQVIKVIRDVSVKQKLEEETKEAKEFLHQVIENAYDIIIVLDSGGKFKLINQLWESITGYKREEWMGKPFTEILAPEYIDIALDKFKLALNGREIKAFEIEILGRDGRKIPLEVNARGLRQDGKISSVVCIARDISERRQMEQQLRSQLKQKIMNMAAHELRTPLQPIIGYLGLIKAEIKNPKILEYIKIVERNALRQRKLIDDMLEHAWMEEDKDKIELKYSKINIKKLVAELLNSYATSTLSFSIKIPDELEIFADRDKLYKVLDNLISNAVGYNSDNIKIEIQAQEQKAEYLFTVHQSTEMKKKQELDLALAKRYVELHGGKIWVESESRKGSTFYFTIPRRGS